MRGGSISLPRPFRSLDGHRPVGVLFPPSARGLEVKLLQSLGDGPDAAGPDGAVVDLYDGCDLEPGAGKEDLVRGVEFRPADLALYDGYLELLGGELHDGVARYAFQDVGRNRRRDELALPDEEDVRRARLGDLPVLGEEDGIVVARPVRLIHSQR